MKGAGAGEWLENDALIANQLVFYITDVRDDRGGGFSGNDRWVVRVEPYYDGEEDPTGLISLTDNPARRKFMAVLDQELEDLLKRGEDPVIGPCCMVRLKGKNYRYIEIVDWDDENKHPILPAGAVPAGARVEEDMRPPRRPRAEPSNGQPEQAEEAKRPFAEAVEAKAEAAPAIVPAEVPPTPKRPARSRKTNAANGPTAPSKTEAVSGPTEAEFPSLREWAIANNHPVPAGPGRYKKDVKEAYERAKAASLGVGEFAAVDPTPEPADGSSRRKPYQGDTEDVERELAIRAAKGAVPEPAQVPVGAPSRQHAPLRSNTPQGEALAAQEVTFRPGMSGTSVDPCPACGKHAHDRIFPSAESSSGYALVHARCEAGGEQKMMEAVPDEEAE